MTQLVAGEPLSVATGGSLDALDHLWQGNRIDELLTRAAITAPHRAALRTPQGDTSFSELDAQVDRFAAALQTVLGTTPTVVALATELTPAFAVAFHGTARAGHTSALVNPLLREDMLRHVLSVANAELLIAPPEVRDRAIATSLPGLHEVVLSRPDPHAPSAITMQDLLVSGSEATPPPADADAVACLQFTSGTTGAAKAARLTHRNLLVNAAQIVDLHELDSTATLLNHLPTFHVMHLNAAIAAAAPHALFPQDDIIAAAAFARRVGATHLYSLPVRLARLASGGELDEVVIPSLRAVLSGGSALLPEHADTLSAHFGVPVAQGYGLAETSPCVCPGTLAGAPAGSCGRLAAATSCRIVDVTTGRLTPVGQLGEIRVKGPQLMAGYVGRDLRADLDEDGWFPTGDLGRLDDEGNLFVVDRLKDVFKRDNWLVAPGRIEAVLRRHQDVADCVVFDLPDETCGAVAQALVVPARPTADPAAISDFVNARVSYYERVEHLRLVNLIPRSPSGKVSRRDLRELTPPFG